MSKRRAHRPPSGVEPATAAGSAARIVRKTANQPRVKKGQTGSPASARPRGKTQQISILERKSRVSVEDFSPGFDPSLRSGEIEKLFPNILAGREFRRLVEAIVRAHNNRRQVIFMIGGHVVKTGVSPLIIQLIESKVVTGLAMNGAAAIHDVEIARWGKTSEDVETALAEGVFGLTSETASFMNAAFSEGFKRKEGMGAALGRALSRAEPPFAERSLIATCYRRRVPLTVHVAIGTDVIHQHPEASGEAIGDTSMRDFRLFSSLIEKIRGGVVVNIGCAVILPEVFLKAIAIARGKAIRFWPITTANLDTIQHYRPLRNVVERPTRLGEGSVGVTLTCHHEIMIPLLAASILHKLRGKH